MALFFKNEYVNTFLLSLLSILFLFTYYYFKLLSLVLVPLSLTPLFFAIYKYKLRTFLIINTPLLLGLAFLLKVLILNYLISMLFPCLIFYLLFRDFTPTSVNRTYWAFLGYAFFLTILMFLILQGPEMKKFHQEGLASVQKAFTQYSDLLKKEKPPVKPEELIKLEELKNLILYALTNYYPSMFFYFLALFYLVNFILSSLLLSRNEEKKPLYLNLFSLKNPEYYIWGFLITWLAVLAAIYFKNKAFEIVLLNIALMLSFFYLLMGGLIVIYRIWLLKYNALIKIIMLLIFFQLILYLMKYSLIALGAVGVLDFWLDFRRMGQTKNQGPDASP